MQLSIGASNSQERLFQDLLGAEMEAAPRQRRRGVLAERLTTPSISDDGEEELDEFAKEDPYDYLDLEQLAARFRAVTVEEHASSEDLLAHELAVELFGTYRALFDRGANPVRLYRRGTDLGLTSDNLLEAIKWGVKHVAIDEAKQKKLVFGGRKISFAFHRSSEKDLHIYYVVKRIVQDRLVYVAHRLHEGGARVVLKCVRVGGDVDSMSRQEMLLREYWMLAAVNGDRIQKVIDCFNTGEQQVLVSKKYDLDMHDYLERIDFKKARLPAEQWQAVSGDAIRAVAQCHEQGLYHGDIKPCNLVHKPAKPAKNKPLRIYLIDGGGSTTRAAFEEAWSVVENYSPWIQCTPNYYCKVDMSCWAVNYIQRGRNPEHAKETAWKIMLAGDVYSLGRALLEMQIGMCKVLPLKINQVHKALRQRGTPRHQANLICRMVNPLWEERPTIAEVAEQWSGRRKEHGCVIS